MAIPEQPLSMMRPSPYGDERYQDPAFRRVQVERWGRGEAMGHQELFQVYGCRAEIDEWMARRKAAEAMIDQFLFERDYTILSKVHDIGVSTLRFAGHVLSSVYTLLGKVFRLPQDAEERGRQAKISVTILALAFITNFNPFVFLVGFTYWLK